MTTGKDPKEYGLQMSPNLEGGQPDSSLSHGSIDLSQIIVPQSLQKLVPIYDIYETLKKDLRIRTGMIQYPTGLKGLDEITWGVHKRELLTVGARTSQGKSVFALEAAKNLAKNSQVVLLLSLEMSKEQIVERLLSNMCEIDNTMLRRGQAWDLVCKKEGHFKEWLQTAPLVIDDQNGYYFKNILEVIDAVKPDFVIVDYVQMISTRGFKDKLAALEDFVKEIHKLGKERNFGAILISQINRAGAEGRPFMHQLKHAGILEEHSDSVILLQWDFEKHTYTVFVEKNRHGMVGELQINFEPQFYRFSDLEGYLSQNWKLLSKSMRD